MINYVFISPHFPPNYQYMAEALAREGIQVLGIGPDLFEALEPRLQFALADYYQVHDLEDYGALLRACGYFISKYGKIHALESHNEHWLESDARLRTDFNIPGYKTEDMPGIKKKSEMKKIFDRAGIPSPRGILIRDWEAVHDFVDELGFPLVVKPDIGVGATRTYKLSDRQDLDRFQAGQTEEDYIMEDFILGEILTFDGLTDREGRPVFTNSFVYADGVLEIVNEGLDTFYYSQKTIPEDLRELGMRILEAFDVRERFFHIEFFRKWDGELLVLEINVRPPGGQSLDMFNYAYDTDIYRIYAAMRAGKDITVPSRPPFHAAYIGVKANRALRHSLEEVLTRHGGLIQTHGPVPPIFSAAMGNYSFLLRSGQLEEIMEAARFIRDRLD